MKKVILFLSVIAMSIISCSKDDDSNSADNILPKRIVNIDGDGDTETTTISYNGKKVIESNAVGSNGNVKDVFTYNGDLISKIETFKVATLQDSDEFQYDSNNRLIVVLGDDNDFDSNGNSIRRKTKQTYTYNADGTVLKTSYNLVNTTYTTNGSTTLYTISNGNEVKEVNTSSYTSASGPGGASTTTTTVSTTINDYDNKNNPLKNILGLDKIMLSSKYSVNNLTRTTRTSTSTSNGVANPVFPARITNYQLTYNANDFLSELKVPYTKTTTVDGVSTTVTKTDITQYFYE